MKAIIQGVVEKENIKFLIILKKLIEFFYFVKSRLWYFIQKFHTKSIFKN